MHGIQIKKCKIKEKCSVFKSSLLLKLTLCPVNTVLQYRIFRHIFILVTRAPLTCSITLVTPAPLTCSITHLGHYPPTSCSCRWWTSCFGQQFGEGLQLDQHTAEGTCTQCLGRATTLPVLLACGSS